MRSLILAIAVFVVVPIGLVLAEDPVEKTKEKLADPVERKEGLLHLADGEAVDIKLILNRSGWFITFRRDGSVHAGCGSLPENSVTQPKGTVHFASLLSAVKRLKSDQKTAATSQVAVLRKGDSGATAFYVKDDTLFRYLIASFKDSWTSFFHWENNDRIKKLLEEHPIYDSAERTINENGRLCRKLWSVS